jgi:hypothetical protein
MKTKDLVKDFIKVRLCYLPEDERIDAINDLQAIIESVISDIHGIAKGVLKETAKEPTE